MKKISTLRELQQVSIYIYRDLMKFCEQNDIKVYLHGGSLIGAIRHEGFIPWDDDIDVCMSRPDYEKLLTISNGGKISSKCTVVDPESNSDFNGYIPVVVYNDSKLVSGQYRHPEDLKISVSIFIYDGISENKLIQKLYYMHMYALRAEHALCRADFNHVNTKAAKIFGPFLQRFYSDRGINKYKNKVLRLQKKFRYEKSKMVSTNADYKASVEVFPKADFESFVNIQFEGINSYTYSYYDLHLKKYYGNYMQLPPVEEQTAKHDFDAWIEDSFDFG